MTKLTVTRSHLSGDIVVPSSKSHSQRAILFASLASGVSHLNSLLASPDIEAMLIACEQIGAKIIRDGATAEIHGIAGKPAFTEGVTIDVGNSGQVLRFLGCVLALGDNKITLTGDHSVQTTRLVTPMIEGLTQLGAECVSLKNNNLAPLEIRGPLHAGTATIEGQDSQPVSGLLIAAAFADGVTEINVLNAGEKPWVALTLDWFDCLGIGYQNNNFEHYTVEGNTKLNGFDYTVPGDFSSVAYPIAAALLTNSELTLHNVDMTDVQGDKALIAVMQSMGAKITVDATARTLHVAAGAELHGVDVDINNFVDSVNILAVLGCFAKGETRIRGAAIARHKECDRLACLTEELTKMGADIQETDDGLLIRYSQLHAATVQSHKDHRMVLALAVAGMALDGDTVIQDTACIAKSYPGFVSDLSAVGAKLNVSE